MNNLTKSAIAIVVATTALAAVMTLLPFKDRSVFKSAPADAGSISVIALGDHGRGDFRQRRVAALMEAECRTEPVDFIQTVGDNFYPSGVESVNDDQWLTDFESIYDTPCLMATPFFGALGNHDYQGNPGAQVEYAAASMGSKRWRMPARYYVHSYGPDSQPLVTLVVLDTMQPLEDQLGLLQTAFGQGTTPGWRVVVGHHNVRTYSDIYESDDRLRKALLPTLKALKVHLYLSGHSHNLQLIAVPGEPAYVVTGGGGSSPRRLNRGDPSVQLFAAETLGFVRLRFRPDTLEVEFHDTSGTFLTDFSSDTRSFELDRACLAAGSTGCATMR